MSFPSATTSCGTRAAFLRTRAILLIATQISRKLTTGGSIRLAAADQEDTVRGSLSFSELAKIALIARVQPATAILAAVSLRKYRIYC